MKIDRATIEKIAHLARLEIDEKDIPKMMEDMSKMVAGVDATVSMQVDDLTINGDRAAFLQLVENLINNGATVMLPLRWVIAAT